MQWGLRHGIPGQWCGGKFLLWYLSVQIGAGSHQDQEGHSVDACTAEALKDIYSSDFRKIVVAPEQKGASAFKEQMCILVLCAQRGATVPYQEPEAV